MQILYLKQILISNFTCRDSCQEVVSLLYGHVIVVLTLVMPILGLQSHIDQTYAELFYIYLLLCSILYLIFVQIDLMYLKWVSISSPIWNQTWWLDLQKWKGRHILDDIASKYGFVYGKQHPKIQIKLCLISFILSLVPWLLIDAGLCFCQPFHSQNIPSPTLWNLTW